MTGLFDDSPIEMCGVETARPPHEPCKMPKPCRHHDKPVEKKAVVAEKNLPGIEGGVARCPGTNAKGKPCGSKPEANGRCKYHQHVELKTATVSAGAGDGVLSWDALRAAAAENLHQSAHWARLAFDLLVRDEEHAANNVDAMHNLPTYNGKPVLTLLQQVGENMGGASSD